MKPYLEKFNNFNLGKNNKFVNRVIMLSFPTGMVFLMLVALKMLPFDYALIAYFTILFFNATLLFPAANELKQLKKYMAALAQGNDGESIILSEEDAKEIANSINAMHRFWSSKTDSLEAQTISDAAVLDTLPDPIVMINREGHIIGANLSARTLLGKNVMSKNIYKIFDSINFVDAVQKVLKKESEAENLIFYVKEPQQQKLYAHIKELPWISKGQAVAVISLYNLTKAMKVEKMQSDFVANASHELRTPLSVISGFIETLQTTAKDDEEARDKFLKIMKDQAEYMAMLIDNLLSLSRIELMMDQKPDDQVDIGKIIRAAIESLTLRAKEKEIRFRVKVAPDVPIIAADERQIKQLIQNLSDNAVKYGVPASDVTIKAEMVDIIPGTKSTKVAKGKAVSISINNRGMKISPENLARLTEKFYRLQEHKDMNIKGTGLGLSIAKQIIIRHRGNLTVSSSAYSGTTFTIYIPVKNGE